MDSLCNMTCLDCTVSSTIYVLREGSQCTERQSSTSGEIEAFYGGKVNTITISYFIYKVHFEWWTSSVQNISKSIKIFLGYS